MSIIIFNIKYDLTWHFNHSRIEIKCIARREREVCKVELSPESVSYI